MLNSIQHFTENGIPQLEEIMKKFMQNPADLNQFVDQVKQVMLEFGCHIVSETLEECNTMLEESVKRKISWQIKDRAERTLLTSLGQLRFSRTRFTHKKSGKPRTCWIRCLVCLPIPVSVRMPRRVF